MFSERGTAGFELSSMLSQKALVTAAHVEVDR